MGQISDILFLLAAISFWFVDLALLIYFAKKPRTPKQKLLSLVIPVAVAIVGADALYYLSGSRFDSIGGLVLPLTVLVIWSLSAFVVLIVPHFFSVFVRKQNWLYGTFAVLFVLSPATTVVNNVMDSQRRSRELKHLKLAAEPVIAACCSGNPSSCHDVAVVFSKASELGGYQQIDHELRNKYYAVACRRGSQADCKEFEYGTGVRFGQTREPIYDELCDIRDLDRHERHRFYEED